MIGAKVIFGSNTSTLPITSLAQIVERPASFIGMHFFSPVERMLLVEIIIGKETGDAALAAALDYVRAIRGRRSWSTIRAASTPRAWSGPICAKAI